MNKLLKILVIFLFAILSVLLIYYNFYKEDYNILSIGDDLSLGKTPFNTYNKSYNSFFNDINDSFITDDLTYKEIHNKLYYDETIYFKGRYLNIRSAIKQSDIIIMTANNGIAFNKCNKNERVFIEYLEKEFETITKIVDIIYRISNPIIVVLTPYCGNYNSNIDNYINKYYSYKKVFFINLYNKIHDKYNFIPNKNNPYPSIEGQYYIYSEIMSIINSV